MKSVLHSSFRRDFARLPERVKSRARQAYGRFASDPWHRSLHFKQLKATPGWWSARVGGGYRVVGIRVEEDTIIWFFIGSHAEYDRLLANH